MKKFISLLLAAVLSVTLFTGCSETTGKIAASVAEAARKELEVQVKAALEENKLEVIEAFEDAMNTPSTEPTAEERIAAAMEYQNALAE